jgi:hypothetical protein
MLDAMLGHYKFQGVHVATQAVLTLYAQGITTGVVLGLTLFIHLVKFFFFYK